MPKYIAVNAIWLSHENRFVNAGESFETTFPKAKTADGKEIDMRLGSNIKLADGEQIEEEHDIDELRRAYEELFGEKPHHNTSAKTLQEKIDALKQGLSV